LKGFISDCNKVGIPWFASVHDFYSLKKILPFGPKYIKVASREARIGSFLACVKELTEGRVPIIISTGGLLFEQIEQIYNQMSRGHLTLVHTSCLYPCGIENLNMNRVRMMKDKFDCNIGYSGHEQGFLPTLYATALGVNYIERHFTLEDRQKKVAKGKEGFQDDLCTLGPETFAEMVNGVRLFMQLIKQNTDKGNLPLELERVNAYGIPDWDGHDVFVR
jgi:N-acetylneuraminate synthase